ncbi:MAG TPA: Fe-S cluster assembly protein SufD [Afifellaceae bacterium]|nr:Fe-S cluster assembly protein SufD [Afifellaceae bacterium]
MAGKGATDIKRVETAAEKAVIGHFDSMPGDDPMHDVRASAFDVIRHSGLPNRRVEDWKYTDLRTLLHDVPAPAGPGDVEKARAILAESDPLADLAGSRIVFVNGQFVPSLSDMAAIADQVDFASLGRFLADGGAIFDRFDMVDPSETPIMALNSAFMSDGAVLNIKQDADVEKPIHLAHLFVGEEAGLQTLRNLVSVESGAKATIFETYHGPDGLAYHTNTVSQIHIAEQAEVRWIKLVEDGSAAVHLGLSASRLDANAVFDPFTYTAGPALTRNEMRMVFSGRNTKSGIRGATLVRDDGHADFTLLVDHAVPDCESREYFKSVIDDTARAVFQGKIIVRPDAQHTVGQMMSQALLLDEGGEFDNKPELEIFADDVICAHGATCGQIDEEMLFFLRSRGIGEAEAEQLLVQAFLAEAIEEMGDEAVEQVLEARTRKWLGMAPEVE